MAEPKIRFRRDDGSSYPTWKNYCIDDLFYKIGTRNKDNILFIDASKEYKPGKVQNELTPEIIQKIVDTYVNRVDVPKYAHVATMEEIKENDWNLNIPRYVDTAEEEEEIDIATVKAELAEITAKKQAAMEKVNITMKLLGL